jgi:hypothetical protein
MTAQRQSAVQVLWGAALVTAGIGVFFRVSQVMPRVESIGQFAHAGWLVRGCFYLLGLLLIGGGVRKLRHHLPRLRRPGSDR